MEEDIGGSDDRRAGDCWRRHLPRGGVANALEGGYGDKFTAYMEPEYFDGVNHYLAGDSNNDYRELSSSIVVQDYDKWQTFEGAVIAFCFNMGKSLPPSGEILNTLELDRSYLPELTRKQAHGDLHQYADNPLSDAIDGPVIDVIYNADRVGRYYGLQDWEINLITQQAIWHYTDSVNPNKDRIGRYQEFPENMWRAYGTLIGADIPRSPGLIKAPGNVVLDIYESDQSIKSSEGKSYQHLLGTTLREVPEYREITPSLKTFAHGQSVDDKTIGAEGGTINDIVTYSGLDTSKEYTIEGELMVRGENGEPEATGITGKTESFTPAAHLGRKTVEFNLTAEQAAKYAGKALVVFETLKSDGKVVAEHHDINDKDQTVTVDEEETPELSLKTEARNQDTGDQTLPASGGVIVDKVTYEGLTVGEEYTVTGELMERLENGDSKATGIKGETTFTAESENGTVEVEFEVPGDYAGKTLVVFEKAFDAEGELVASHEDIDDEDQTVTVEEKETPVGSSSGWWGWLIGLFGIGGIGSSIGGSSEGSSQGSSGGSSHHGSTGSSHEGETSREEVPHEGEGTPRGDIPEQSRENKPEQAESTTTSGLANTGANVVGLIIAGLVLVAVGGALHLRRREA